jgi:hypothetical protein
MLARIAAAMQRQCLSGVDVPMLQCGNAPQFGRQTLTIDRCDHNLGATHRECRKGPGVHAFAES